MDQGQLGPDSLNTYKTSLDLIAKDRPGLAMDITTVMASSKINILGMNVNVLPDGYAKMNLVVEVRAQSEVTTIMNKLNQVRGFTKSPASVGEGIQTLWGLLLNRQVVPFGPSQGGPCNVVPRPVPGGGSRLSLEKPGRKESRGMPPAPPF